jgi:hypothetical protein
MAEVMDIASIKKIISMGAKLGNVCGMAFQDGKLGMDDIALIPQLIQIIPLAIEVKWTEVLPEIKDFSLAEGEELLAHFRNEFDIPQENIEITIELVLSVVLKITSLIIELIQVFKKK